MHIERESNGFFFPCKKYNNVSLTAAAFGNKYNLGDSASARRVHPCGGGGVGGESGNYSFWLIYKNKNNIVGRKHLYWPTRLILYLK